jgi:hypothetical protein
MSTKAFAVFLQELRDGRAHAEMTAKLEELLNAVRETGKGGSITFKLKIKPSGRGADVDKVTVADDITASLPELEHGDDMFYLTEDLDLSRNHPRQRSLELREPPSTQPTELKEITK